MTLNASAEEDQAGILIVAVVVAAAAVHTSRVQDFHVLLVLGLVITSVLVQSRRFHLRKILGSSTVLR